jgi:TetR/AcrR family fatty acid metabolism transcriptional regulator
MSPRGNKLNEQMRSDAIAKITRAALEVFAAYGYYGSTMDKIMKVSGLSKGLVYHYFPSKEKVFFHLVDSALEISKNTWMDAFNSPGTAWEKIEKLSENIARTAFTDESSLYSLIMIQAVTEGKGIPGLLEHVFENLAYYTELHSLIVEAQKSGEAAPGDADVMMFTYISLIQGLALYTSHDDALRKKLTPDIFTNVLRNPGRSK